MSGLIVVKCDMISIAVFAIASVLNTILLTVDNSLLAVNLGMAVCQCYGWK